MRKTSQKGQVLLIVVLIMVIALTVGLSVASRSITNLKISVDDENSQRAFSAAEAGVERLIKSDCNPGPCIISLPQQFTNNASFTGTATSIEGDSFLAKGGTAIKQDEGVDIWLSDYSANPTLLYGNPKTGDVNIFWGDAAGDCSNAAVEIIVLSGNTASPQLSRNAYDPCGARRSSNNFSAPNSGGTVASKTFAYRVTITVNQGIIMRVIPIYTNTTFGLSGISFPLQGKQIEVAGRAGGTIRKITFVQGFSTVPGEFFQYALMSP